MEGGTQGRKEGQMEGLMDRPYFIGPFEPWPGSNKKYNTKRVMHSMRKKQYRLLFFSKCFR